MGCVWSARGGWFRWGMYTGPVGVGTIRITNNITGELWVYDLRSAGPTCSMGDNARLTVPLTGRGFTAGHHRFQLALVLLCGIFDRSPSASRWHGPPLSSGVLLLRCSLRWLCLTVLLLDPHYVWVWHRSVVAYLCPYR